MYESLNTRERKRKAYPVTPHPEAKNGKKKESASSSSSSSSFSSSSPKQKRRKLTEIQHDMAKTKRRFYELKEELEKNADVKVDLEVTDHCARKARVRLFKHWATKCFEELGFPQMKSPEKEVKQYSDAAAVLDIGNLNRKKEVEEEEEEEENEDMVTEASEKQMRRIIKKALSQLWDVRAFIDESSDNGGKDFHYELSLQTDDTLKECVIICRRHNVMFTLFPKDKNLCAPAETVVLAQVIVKTNVHPGWICHQIQSVGTNGSSEQRLMDECYQGPIVSTEARSKVNSIINTNSGNNDAFNLKLAYITKDIQDNRKKLDLIHSGVEDLRDKIISLISST